MAVQPVATSAIDRAHDERYQRLMAATRKAARSGYDAVSMRDLAKATRMSMTTIYQYCSSKDHLIAEAHLEWMEHFRDELLRHPPRGRSAAARARAYIAQIISAWENQPILTMTMQRAIYSMDPGVREVRALAGRTYADIMRIALGDTIANRDAVIEVLGHVINSVTHDWVSGSLSTAEARRVLERTVATLLPN